MEKVIQTESLNDDYLNASSQDILSDNEKAYDGLQDRIDKLDSCVTLLLESYYVEIGFW